MQNKRDINWGGMLMPDRNYSPSTFAGFNGKRMDNEISGQGNSYDFGARLYDPRRVQWNTTDKFKAYYAGNSPYSFALNNPILNTDKGGNFVIEGTTEEKAVLIKFVNAAKKSLSSSPFLLDALMEFSGLSENQIKEAFIDGKGPILNVQKFKNPNFLAETYNRYTAHQDLKGVDVLLDSKISISDLFMKNSEYMNATPEADFLRTVILLHELVHYGLAKTQFFPQDRTFLYKMLYPTLSEQMRIATEPYKKYTDANKIEDGKALEVRLSGEGLKMSTQTLQRMFKGFKTNESNFKGPGKTIDFMDPVDSEIPKGDFDNKSNNSEEAPTG